jgi:hypothetical protein
LNLEKVAEILGEELAIQSSSPTSEAARLRERQQKFENWAGIAGLTTFGLILLLLIIVVFTQMILKGGLLIVPGALLILLAIGAGAMAVFQVYSKSLKAKLADRPMPPPATDPLPIEKPGTFDAQIVSVTERTTALLDQNEHAKTTDIGN